MLFLDETAELKILIVGEIGEEDFFDSEENLGDEIRVGLNCRLKENFSENFIDFCCSESFVNGFALKNSVKKSRLIDPFLKDKDRSIEIVEASRRKSTIEIRKYFPLENLDFSIFSFRFRNENFSSDDFWKIFEKFKRDEPSDLFSASAFNFSLDEKFLEKIFSIVEFSDRFKSIFSFSKRRDENEDFLFRSIFLLPLIKLGFRPKIFRRFDERIGKNPSLEKLREKNLFGLAARGSNDFSFSFDFSLYEKEIFDNFNEAQRTLFLLAKKFREKYFPNSFDENMFRTSILWLCENHQLENYHDVFEIWIYCLAEICRKKYLSHYFLPDVNVFRENQCLEQILHEFDETKIRQFQQDFSTKSSLRNVSFHHNRNQWLVDFLRSQPVLTLKMKTVYQVIVQKHFPDSIPSIERMSNIISLLSIFEDQRDPFRANFWTQIWKPILLDIHNDQVVLRQPKQQFQPDQIAEFMVQSVFSLLQIDFSQLDLSTR